MENDYEAREKEYWYVYDLDFVTDHLYKEALALHNGSFQGNKEEWVDDYLNFAYHCGAYVALAKRVDLLEDDELVEQFQKQFQKGLEKYTNNNKGYTQRFLQTDK